MIKDERIRFGLKLIKVAAGVAGGALVLTENHPYLTVCILIVGAVANEALNYKGSK